MRSFYTWSNGHINGSHTLKKLDRGICNLDWLSLCTRTSCHTLPKVRSDHYPLKLELKFSTIFLSSQFKFLQTWSIQRLYLEVVKNSWKVKVSEWHVFVLSEKVKLLKTILRLGTRIILVLSIILLVKLREGYPGATKDSQCISIKYID